MNVFDTLMEAVATMAEETAPYASIVFGSDPPENGICMMRNAGYPDETHLNKGFMFRMPVLLNGKHSEQQTVLNALEAIHTTLTKATDYSELNNDEIQVVNIETTAFPSIIGREQNNQWICGSSFEISFYWR